VTFIANDSSGNENTTEITNFTVQDSDALTITPLSCTPDPANISDAIRCNATVTDDVGVHTVTANVRTTMFAILFVVTLLFVDRSQTFIYFRF